MFTDPLTCSILILSFIVTPNIHRSIISFTSSLFLHCWPCLCPVQQSLTFLFVISSKVLYKSDHPRLSCNEQVVVFRSHVPPTRCCPCCSRETLHATGHQPRARRPVTRLRQGHQVWKRGSATDAHRCRHPRRCRRRDDGAKG